MISYREEASEVISIELFTPGVCDQIIERIKKGRGWSRALVRKQLKNGLVRCRRLDRVRRARILDAARAVTIYRQFDRQIDRKVKPLIRNVWQLDLREHAGTQIIRYFANGHYRPHIDSGLDLNDRYFSVLCYFNDDFEGGCTFFPYLNYRAIPRRGRAIIFPSRYMHCAEPVLKGQKFVGLTWVLGPFPIQWL
jgi:2-oxoglutarate-Fe(II)-dependent oxygenase superfamily protein